MGILTAYDKFIQQALKYGFSLWGTAKTGQTASYAIGDDGYLEKGYPKTAPRFKDNEDGTITDNATGLMWAKDGDGVGCNNGGQLTWGSAINWAIGLTFADHSDWRLPNVKELVSIADYGRDSPAIDPTFFPNTKSGYYWTSSTMHPLPSTKWRIWFTRATVSNTSQASAYYVRAVRLGAG